MDAITVEAVRAPTSEVRGLIEELDRTLALEYDAKQRRGLWLDGSPAGCEYASMAPSAIATSLFLEKRLSQ